MIGSVYRIIHLHSNICYVGSTLDSVRNRWQGHKYSYKAYLKNDTDKHTISIYPYFKQYGIDSFKCILVKEYEVEDRNHLLAYEQLWINKFNPINKLNAFNPLLRVNLYRNAYREINKDKINQKQKEYRKTDEYKQKQYYKANKDKIKQYRDDNKDKIKQYQQEYRKTDEAKQKQKEYRKTDEYKQKQKQYQKTDEYKQKQKQYRERRKQLKAELEAELEYEV